MSQTPARVSVTHTSVGSSARISRTRPGSLIPSWSNTAARYCKGSLTGPTGGDGRCPHRLPHEVVVGCATGTTATAGYGTPATPLDASGVAACPHGAADFVDYLTNAANCTRWALPSNRRFVGVPTVRTCPGTRRV